MKKRRYRSTNVKNASPDGLRKYTSGRELVVAVDVAKDVQYAALGTPEEPDGLVTLHFELCQTRAFIELVLSLEPSSVVAVLEPSGTYGEPLIQAFQDASWNVLLVNGKKTKDARELYDGVPSSHDAKSCHILLRLHQERLSRAVEMPTEDRRAMVAASGTLHRRQSALVQLEGQLEGLLARCWPEVTSLLALPRPSLWGLLAAFPGAEAVAAEPKAAAELLRRLGRSFLAEAKVQAIVESARSSLGVRMTQAEQDALQSLASDGRQAMERVRASKRAVEALAQRTPGLETMAPVVGKATAVVLLAELGEVDAYPCAAAYTKAFGLNLREDSSGKHRGQLHISKRGSSRARQALYFAVLRLIKNDEVFRAWYTDKKQRDGGLSMRAIVALMRKLASALWHVGRGAQFDSSKLFDTKKLGLVPAGLREMAAEMSDRAEGTEGDGRSAAM